MERGSRIERRRGGRVSMRERLRRRLRRRDDAVRRTHFLARAGEILSSSLDYHETLRLVTALIVPDIADWCAVDILDSDGQFNRMTVAHTDPEKVRLGYELMKRYPPRRDADHGLYSVIRRGRTELIGEVRPELLRAAAHDEEHLRILKSLGLVSVMIVPLLVRSRAIGTISLATTQAGDRFGPEDIEFAEDLARRAATAVDNARLYEEARAANQAKDVFLATVSHELRTPLTSILGWTQLLRQQGLDEQTFALAVESIENSARTQGRLIEDLLDVSRIASGKLHLQLEPVNLSDIVSTTVRLLLPAAQNAGVSLQTNSEACGEMKVMGDAGRLQQIVWNLLSNALKFTPSGGRVIVDLSCDVSSVVLSVTDTGRGIAPDLLPCVFEPFRQGNGSASKRGLGLGLAIVRHLVEEHRGTVVAESDGEGKGAKFTVRLPLLAPPNS